MSVIGRMRERVSVLEVQKGQPDGIGGWTTTKVVVGTFWANVEQQDGTRAWEHQRVQNTNPYEITMRAGSYVVTADNLLDYRGKELTIESVRVDQEKRYTVVQAYG